MRIELRRVGGAHLDRGGVALGAVAVDEAEARAAVGERVAGRGQVAVAVEHLTVDGEHRGRIAHQGPAREIARRLVHAEPDAGAERVREAEIVGVRSKSEPEANGPPSSSLM